MTETQARRNPSRSILAVLAGFVAVVVLSLGTDVALRAAGILPPFAQPMSNALFLLATVYRSIYSVAGSYIAARLAPARPMKHALALGVVGLVVSIVGALAAWNKTDLGPHWYPLALVALAMPCAWLGGFLQLTREAQP